MGSVVVEVRVWAVTEGNGRGLRPKIVGVKYSSFLLMVEKLGC